MNGIDINVYHNGKASIKDLEKDINVSDLKWSPFFNTLGNLFDSIYFQGDRKWGEEKFIKQSLLYLSERLLFNEDKNTYNRILFKLKHIFMVSNRRLISNLWDFYEYPSLIFLGNEEFEEELIEAYRHNMSHDKIIESIENVVILYRHTELDVIWIRTNIDLELLLHDIS